MSDLNAGNKSRDKRLRKRLLFILDLCKNAPRAGLGGRRLLLEIAEDMPDGMGFEDDAHFMRLMRDLVNKKMVIEENEVRRRGDLFGPDFVFYKITDLGSMLVREEAPIDPDIDDERIAGCDAGGTPRH